MPPLAHRQGRSALAHAAAQQEKAARQRAFVLRLNPGRAARQRHAKSLARRNLYGKRQLHARHALGARTGLFNRFR